MHLPKRSILIIAIIGAFIVGGVAAAAWLSTGTGPARGQAVSAQALTVTARSGPADLYPGATGAVYFTVTNANPYAVTLTTVTYGAVTGGGTGCAPTAANIVKAVGAPATITALVVPAAVGAAPGTVNGVIAGALTMPLTVATECQGMSFDIVVTLGGVSS